MDESYEEPEPDYEQECGDDPFEDEDLDIEVLTNLLQSYTNQPTVDGPVQNIMLSMGKGLPPINEDDLDCYCLLLQTRPKTRQIMLTYQRINPHPRLPSPRSSHQNNQEL